ncbi:MAG: Rieske 2Fe-2S domain-containing protein [Planctomycetota bacterium]
MASKEIVTRVWIEPGCIVCDACETASPTVFHVTDDTCVIRPEALTPDFLKPISESVVDAAAECPVDVIKFETVTAEVGDEVAAPAEAGAGVVVAVAPAPVKAAAKSHDKPVPKQAEPVAAAVSKEAVQASMAGGGDPAIQALLRAATARGGSAGILRKASEIPESVQAMKRQNPSQLPPDARQAKVVEAAQKSKQNPDMQRRAFVGGAALAVGWVTFGVGTGVACGPAFLRFMMPNVLEEPDPRVRVGKLQRYAEMAPGEVNEDFKSQGIWMIRTEDRVAALNIICTHLGCIPNWLPNDRKFKCPCHGSGYQPDGINFEGPTPRPLERFRVYVEDGIIVVDKSKKYQYELGQWDMPGSYLEA